MPESDDLNLEPTEVAASAYRAYCHAVGEAPAAWDGLALERQAPWLRLAKRAEAALERLEGRFYRDIGPELYRVASADGADPHTPANATAWEAVARHLMALLDGDEPPDLGDLERSWGPWAAKRQPQLVTA